MSLNFVLVLRVWAIAHFPRALVHRALMTHPAIRLVARVERVMVVVAVPPELSGTLGELFEISSLALSCTKVGTLLQ